MARYNYYLERFKDLDEKEGLKVFDKTMKSFFLRGKRDEETELLITNFHNLYREVQIEEVFGYGHYTLFYDPVGSKVENKVKLIPFAHIMDLAPMSDFKKELLKDPEQAKEIVKFYSGRGNRHEDLEDKIRNFDPLKQDIRIYNFGHTGTVVGLFYDAPFKLDESWPREADTEVMFLTFPSFKEFDLIAKQLRTNYGNNAVGSW